MSDELMTLARKRAETDALIRDLLAEVERMAGQVEHSREVAKRAVARRLHAEHQMRELASAEPVAWMIEGDPQNLETAGSPAFDIPLIRRPEMPS